MIIDPDFSALIPPLTEEEYNGLEESILAEGCRDALIVWGNILVDGHNRYKICTKHDIPYKMQPIEFASRTEARIWIRKNQLARRNLTDGWKIELELGNKQDLLEIGKQTQGKRTDLLSINDKKLEPPHNTQKIIAESLGMSTGKVAQAEVVRTKAPEVWEQVKEGKETVGGAYQKIKKEEKVAKRKEEIEEQKKVIEKEELQKPNGLFDVIVIDPPWNYGREYDPEASRVASPYPEMSQEELLKIELPAKNDCVLFLWTTHKFIWDAKELMDKWGFIYKACLVWDKEKMGMGAWLRMQCEFCLIGIKGKPFWNNTTYRDIITEARREHSRKPESFYKMVEEITAGRKLDYFSREIRKGWEVFGNDTSKF